MRAGFVTRRIFLLLLIALFLYLSLYTWNLRYRYLDRLSEITGLEIAGTLLRPGNWVADEVGLRWRRYVHLVNVEQENERLREAVARMALDMASLREDSAKAKRLERSFGFNPPEEWQRQGARVIAHRLGPTGSLETFLVDKGAGDGIYEDAPAITADGAVGRVLRVSPNNATVLLLSDPNSRIPVLGRDSRTTGVLVGHGQGQLLSVNYVPLNERMEVGEILVSSGLARVFPKGIPVARVVTVDRSDISLFKTVLAEPLVDVRNLEEVLLLGRLPVEQSGTRRAEDTAMPVPSVDVASVGAAQPKAGKANAAQGLKTSAPQPSVPRKQVEKSNSARQDQSPVAQKKASRPQGNQAPQAAKTQTPPAVQTPRTREIRGQTRQLESPVQPRVSTAQDRPLANTTDSMSGSAIPQAHTRPTSAQTVPSPSQSAPVSPQDPEEQT